MADDLLPTIQQNATQPKSATTDGTSGQQHSLPDQIAADRYSKAAQTTRGLPMRVVKLRPGGNSDLSRDC